MAWRPFVISATVISVLVAGVSFTWGSDPFTWTLATVTALAAGGVVLAFRRRTMEATVRANSRLAQAATTDPLTGLLNRHGIEQAGRVLVSAARQAGQPAFVVFLDVNGLKQVNDRWGHEAGDHALRVTAHAAREAMGPGDLLGRWGGDEFIAVGMGQAPEVEELQSRLALIVEGRADRERWPGGVSVGVASAAGDFEDLVSAADHDMYGRRRLRRACDAASAAPEAIQE